jgi:endonuclease YncB( thermonuclease family)
MGNCCRASARPPREADPLGRLKRLRGDGVTAAVAHQQGRRLTDEDRIAQAVSGSDFTFAGQRFLAKVVDYYSGDIVRVVFIHRGKLDQYRAKMAGYVSPEIKPSRTSVNRTVEAIKAVAARNALMKKINNALVYIECGGYDRFGRILVTVYLRDGTENGESVNAWMIANGHGVVYDSGKKALPEIDRDGGAPARPGADGGRRGVLSVCSEASTDDEDEARPRSGEWEPPRSGEWEPPRSGEWEPPRSGEWEPPHSGEWAPPRSGEWAPPRSCENDEKELSDDDEGGLPSGAD